MVARNQTFQTCLRCGLVLAEKAFKFTRETDRRDTICRECLSKPHSIRLAELVVETFPEATWEPPIYHIGPSPLMAQNEEPAYPEGAIEKCIERKADFLDNEWTRAEVFDRAPTRHGHHGLAWSLQPHQDLGRIWEWCAEILGRPAGHGERSRLYYWKREPLAMLLARFGRAVIPFEIDMRVIQ